MVIPASAAISSILAFLNPTLLKTFSAARIIPLSLIDFFDAFIRCSCACSGANLSFNLNFIENCSFIYKDYLTHEYGCYCHGELNNCCCYRILTTLSIDDILTWDKNNIFVCLNVLLFVDLMLRT